jgi:hypothetical protein
VRSVGRWLSSRFVRNYEQRTGIKIDPIELEWYQAVICLRALLEVAAWVDGGIVDAHQGHPWLTGAAAYARRLTQLTAVLTRPR